MNFGTIKRLKFKIKAHGSIMREKELERSEKLSEINKNYILKLISDSPSNTLNRIALKLKKKYEVEVLRGIIFRFLVENDYKWKGPQILTETMSRTKRIDLNFISKIRKEIGAMYLLQMKLLSIFITRKT